MKVEGAQVKDVIILLEPLLGLGLDLLGPAHLIKMLESNEFLSHEDLTV